MRPWLYRIARNRSLNHLRKAQAIGVDSMDVHLSEHGLTTADKVHKREEFRQLMSDVQDLPETQRTALLLREIDALSYEQIAEAMETTVPSVKSLLVRARVALAEAAEARLLTCEEVRDELGEVAEGLRRTTPPVRRHLRTCERCQRFRKQLRQTNRALAAVFPVGPLLLLKKALLAHAGTAAAGSGGAAAAGGERRRGRRRGRRGRRRRRRDEAGAGALASKAVAGLAAAAIVTAGAVEVKHVKDRPRGRPRTPPRSRRRAAGARRRAVVASPSPVASAPQPVSEPAPAAPARRAQGARRRAAPREGQGRRDADPDAHARRPPPPRRRPGATPTPTPAPRRPPNVEQHEGDTIALPGDPRRRPAADPDRLGARSRRRSPLRRPTPAPSPAPTPPPTATPAPSPVPTPIAPSGCARRAGRPSAAPAG